jgi:23S rRNA (guanine2445-N2)-methyltransferase / 23S rRNA (guanine2069-N7)-methyltransferase
VSDSAAARGHAHMHTQAEMLANRVRKRARHLRKWAQRQGVTCYRLYDRDIPEIALAIDWYEGHLHISRYRRERDDAEPPQWLTIMAEAAAGALDLPAGRVHIKERQRQRGPSQYQRLGDSDVFMVVSEGGHRFAVNLDDYLDTGLFLDHRLTRARVEREAAGARFLNLFCYTGAFTVYAAAGGARETLSVDLSNRYLDWAWKNLELNGLAGPAHRLVRADAREHVRRPPRQLFDLAVLDPPTFSASKKMQGTLDIKRDQRELINHTLGWLRRGGVLYFSTNARRFKLDHEAIDAAAIEDISAATTSEDFSAHPGHRCWRITR